MSTTTPIKELYNSYYFLHVDNKYIVSLHKLFYFNKLVQTLFVLEELLLEGPNTYPCFLSFSLKKDIRERKIELFISV